MSTSGSTAVFPGPARPRARDLSGSSNWWSACARIAPTTTELLQRAFEFAAEQHGTQMRKSGEPYPFPPPRSRAHPRRYEAGCHRACAPRCCTTWSKTRTSRWRRFTERFGPRRRAAGRRRHQDQPPRSARARSAPGRKRPQDAAGHGQRRSRRPREAGRPPAQHAHARISAMPRSRSASPARLSTSTPRSPPPRHGHDSR